ncbi:MAG: gliding motility-associated-like protein, partial [Flavobacteriales bacterium]
PVADAAVLADLTAQCNVAAPTSPTATDNCDGVVTGVASPAFPITTQGTTIVTWTFTDVVGNSSTQNQNVIITDNIAPVADAASLPNLSAQCNVAAPTSPTATDNCDGVVTGVASPAFPITTQGTTVVTWTFTDAVGNSSTQTQNVTITDITPPVVACSDISIYLDVNGDATITGADLDGGSADNCGIATLSPSQANFTCANIGANVVALTVTDNSGNSASCNSTVTVLDTINPTVICQNITIQLDGSGNASIVSSDIDNGSSDACGITTYAISQSNFDCSSIGANNVTLVITDNNGNIDSCIAVVTIQDNISPVVSCPADFNEFLDGNCDFTVPDYSGSLTVLDNCSSGAGLTITQSPVSGVLLSSAQTNQLITITVTDANGNQSSCGFTITLLDTLAPTFVCPSDQEVLAASDCIYQIEDYTDLVTSSMDNCDNSSLTITQIPAAGTSVTAGSTSSAGYDGQTLVQIVVEDLSGNVDTCDFIVDVICEDELFIPGFFSPNDDNKNDLFVIDGLEKFPNNNIQIFNRWGNKVFEMDDYNGNWNGVSEGAFTIGVGPLPAGTYFYILDLGDGSNTYNGYVELQR